MTRQIPEWIAMQLAAVVGGWIGASLGLIAVVCAAILMGIEMANSKIMALVVVAPIILTAAEAVMSGLGFCFRRLRANREKARGKG